MAFPAVPVVKMKIKGIIYAQVHAQRWSLTLS
jgi:hypothetical protein